MRRNVVSAAAAIAAVVLFGIVSGSAALNNPSKATTIKVVQTTTSIHFPSGGLNPGGTITLTTKETSGGRQVGTSQVACVIVAGTMAQCQATTFASKGQIQGQGPINIANPSQGSFAIVGGTGTYKTARGFITRTKLTATTTQVTYHIIG
jgi:hypothetical protein